MTRWCDKMSDSANPSAPTCGEKANADEVWNLMRPNRDSLKKLKRVSIRNRLWFKAINWKQRRFIDAVIMTVERVRSLLMLRVLAPIVEKLLVTFGGDMRKGALSLMGEGAYGMMRSVAEKIVHVAEKWGNKSAHEWLRTSFFKYLIIMNLPQNRNMSTIAF